RRRRFQTHESTQTGCPCLIPHVGHQVSMLLPTLAGTSLVSRAGKGRSLDPKCESCHPMNRKPHGDPPGAQLAKLSLQSVPLALQYADLLGRPDSPEMALSRDGARPLSIPPRSPTNLGFFAVSRG